MAGKFDPRRPVSSRIATTARALRHRMSASPSGDLPRVNGTGIVATLLASMLLTFGPAISVTLARLHDNMQTNVDRSLIKLESLLHEVEADLETLAALLPDNCGQARNQLVRSSLDSSLARDLFALYPGSDLPCGPLPDADDSIVQALRVSLEAAPARAAGTAAEGERQRLEAERRRLKPIPGPPPGLAMMLNPGNGTRVLARIDSKQIAMAADALDFGTADGYRILLRQDPPDERDERSGADLRGFEVAGRPPGSRTLFHVTATTPAFDMTVVAHLTVDRFARQFLISIPATLALAASLALLLLMRFNGRLAQRASAARRLQEAVRKRRFEPVVQPIVDARSGRCLGGEVLMRWDHPIRGLVAPAEFIGLAEQSGLIGPMTEILMKKARDRLAPIVAAVPDLYFSFNVTAIDLSDPGFPDRLDGLFDDQSLSPHNVMIELIERDALDQRISGGLARLRERGYRIAIDDFGTGQSSLSVLARLPADRLKIDREFVRSIDEQAINRPVLEAIIDLSRKMRLPAIAEGVETPAQRAFLVAHGVAALQGYLIARPMPISDFWVWLKDNLERFRQADDARPAGASTEREVVDELG